MTLTRKAYVGAVLLMVLFTVIAVFTGNQRLAQADELEVQGPGLPTECSDLIDNDNDGLSDFVPVFGDPDCESMFDESESGSSGGGGGGNPPLNQCMDGIDNDNDGDVDLADDGCVNAGDDDESDEGNNGGGGEEPPADVCPNIDGVQTEVPAGKVITDGNCVDAPTGGGGGGSTDPAPGGGGGSTDTSGGGGGGGGSGGEVLGATTTEAVVEAEATTTPEVISCDTYLTAFIKAGQKNDAEQVTRLQSVLKNYEEADVEENGEYDAKTLDAVKAFQSKYAREILTPWGIQKPTGYVFLTTRKKVNEVYCKNAQTFPLTEEEEQQIAQARAAADTEVKTPTIPAAVKPLPAKTEEKKPVETKPVTSADETSESAVDLPGSRFTDFFRRLFDRFR